MYFGCCAFRSWPQSAFLPQSGLTHVCSLQQRHCSWNRKHEFATSRDVEGSFVRSETELESLCVTSCQNWLFSLRAVGRVLTKLRVPGRNGNRRQEPAGHWLSPQLVLMKLGGYIWKSVFEQKFNTSGNSRYLNRHERQPRIMHWSAYTSLVWLGVEGIDTHCYCDEMKSYKRMRIDWFDILQGMFRRSFTLH